MSDSVRPQRWQPTRLRRPWDSPGKTTGVGCHFLLQCMKVKSEREVAQSCPTLRDHGLQSTRRLHPWDFPGKSTGVGCHCLLQCMKVKSQSEVTQSCLTLCDPMDCSPPGSSIHRIFQARVLVWGAIKQPLFNDLQIIRISFPSLTFSILYLHRYPPKKLQNARLLGMLL